MISEDIRNIVRLSKAAATPCPLSVNSILTMSSSESVSGRGLLCAIVRCLVEIRKLIRSRWGQWATQQDHHSYKIYTNGTSRVGWQTVHTAYAGHQIQMERLAYNLRISEVTVHCGPMKKQWLLIPRVLNNGMASTSALVASTDLIVAHEMASLTANHHELKDAGASRVAGPRKTPKPRAGACFEAYHWPKISFLASPACSMWRYSPS